MTNKLSFKYTAIVSISTNTEKEQKLTASIESCCYREIAKLRLIVILI